jgi:hypothetical protein
MTGRLKSTPALATVALGLAIAGLAGAPGAQADVITNASFGSGTWNSSADMIYLVGNTLKEGSIVGAEYVTQSYSDIAGSELSLTYDYNTVQGWEYVEFDGVEVPGSYSSNASGTVTVTLGYGTGYDTLGFVGANQLSFNSITIDSVTSTEVPEPASIALLGTSLFGLGLIRHRRA